MPADDISKEPSGETPASRSHGMEKGLLAGLIVSAFVGICYIIVIRLAPGASGEILMFIGTMIGYLASMAQTAINYFFGSSQGASATRDAFNKLAGK